MNHSITVIPWNNGHANVGLSNTQTMPSRNKPADATQTVRRNGRTISRDGRYRYVRQFGTWHVQEIATGQWLYADDDKIEMGFAVLRYAAEFTHARDAARAAADAIKARIRRADLTDDEHENDGTSHSIDTDLAQGR